MDESTAVARILATTSLETTGDDRTELHACLVAAYRAGVASERGVTMNGNTLYVRVDNGTGGGVTLSASPPRHGQSDGWKIVATSDTEGTESPILTVTRCADERGARVFLDSLGLVIAAAIGPQASVSAPVQAAP